MYFQPSAANAAGWRRPGRLLQEQDRRGGAPAPLGPRAVEEGGGGERGHVHRREDQLYRGLNDFS